MKILVTGGAGFIGSHFVRRVISLYPDDEIINLDVLTYAGNLENLREVESSPRYRFVKGDILDRELVDQLVRLVDAVVHFAAESHVDRSIDDPALFLRTNVLGTEVILEAVRRHKKRYHHISTDEVFGSLLPDDPAFNEQTPYRPRSPYSASKAASDHLVRAYTETYGLEATISNCSNNYGPNMYPEKIIPLFVNRLIEGKKVPVYGDGLQVRDWIHVSDHVRAVDLILRSGKIGETYCVGGNNEIPNIELTKKILKFLDKDESSIEYVKDRPGHDRRYAIDSSKIKKELGFTPEISFDEGLKNTVDWYVSNQAWVKNCQKNNL